MLTFQHLKRYTAIFCFAGVVSMPSLAGVHVDVNIGVGSPGYYGVLPIQGVTPSLWNANPIVAIGNVTAPSTERAVFRCISSDAAGTTTTMDTQLPLLLRALGSCLLPRTMPPHPLRRENTAAQDTLKIMVGNIGRQVTIGTVTDTAIRKSTTRINFCRISAFIWRSGRNIGSDFLCLF